MTATQPQAPEPQPPAGFRPLTAAEPTGPRIGRDALTHGVIVQYRATRRFPKPGGGAYTVVQIFLARGGKGQRFSIFGTSQLDSKLASVKPGAILWMQYAGKANIEGNDTHNWNLSDAGSRLSPEQLDKLLANSEKEHAALDDAIAKAQRENAARTQTGAPDSDEFAPVDDNDLPY